MEPLFLKKLDELRDNYGKPIILNSAYRCPDHNRAVSSSKSVNGPHTTGKAVDIRTSRKEAYTVLSLAFLAGFTGIGVAQKGSGRFIHLDMLGSLEGAVRPTIWSY